jgi:hypothetical protein
MPNGKLHEPTFIKWVEYMVDSRHIANAMKAGKVLLFKFEDYDTEKILEFLGVSPKTLPFHQSNSIDVWYTEKYEQYRNSFEDMWRKNFKLIMKIVYEDLKKIKSLIDVSDYIRDLKRKMEMKLN